MKKKIFAIAVVMICISILGYGSLAYFATEDTARNVITADGLDVSIEEWQQTEAGLVPYPKEQSIVIMPTSKVSKIVTVKNHQAQSFVRAKLDVTILDSTGEKMVVSAAEQEKIIILNMNRQNWTEKDGWWYYTGAVNAGEATQPLMTGVEFDGPNMTNAYQNCTVLIDVTVQAVQAAHNSATALEAQGWPAD